MKTSITSNKILFFPSDFSLAALILNSAGKLLLLFLPPHGECHAGLNYRTQAPGGYRAGLTVRAKCPANLRLRFFMFFEALKLAKNEIHVF